jgi:2-oxoglutarate dehydrogenase E2 component (dihydrolipoamide succinyltransferase)
MAIAVELPALGESVLEGTVSRWLVKEGDRVERDQPLVEITTDKVDAEIPSPAAGIIEKILVAEGATVQVGAELARIAPGAVGTTAAPPTSAGARAASTSPPPAARPASRADARPTPVARKFAEETQTSLEGVQGTGIAGRVTRRDVESVARGAAPPRAAREVAAAAASEPAPRSPRTGPPTSPASKPAFLSYQLQPGDKVIPMTPLRRLVAEHMVLSKRTSPHVGTVAEIDLLAVVRFREKHKRAFQDGHGFPLTYLPFIVHATVRALREFPRLNASVLEDAIVEKKDVHLGIAVETEKGLVVPVVRHADRLSLVGLAEAVEDISSRARTKKLSADELKGGTFTLSNPGRNGNLYGFAIINQPQVGILRMGEIVKRPVVRELEGEDAIVVRPIMHLALSYDHRAVDGAPANGFLFRVKQLLEEAEFDL